MGRPPGGSPERCYGRDMTEIDEKLQAAAFRTLVAHLQDRTDVQNIDLMNLSGFCRNCLSKYLVKASQDAGGDVTYEDARTHVYGMPYADWKAKYQTEATPEQMAKFKETH